MGMLDSKLQFSNAQVLTATAASTSFYDQLTGELDTTTFTTAPNDIWGTSTYFGEDLGIGKGPGTPRVICNVGTVITSGGATTGMTIQFRGAPNNVTAQASGNRSDLVFVIYIQTDAIALALLTANTRIASFDWPMRQTGHALPRFVDLNYVMAGGSAAGGTISSDVTLGDEDAQSTLPYYPNNYRVAS